MISVFMHFAILTLLVFERRQFIGKSPNLIITPRNLRWRDSRPFKIAYVRNRAFNIRRICSASKGANMPMLFNAICHAEQLHLINWAFETRVLFYFALERHRGFPKEEE